MSTISVIVPVYKVEKYLTRCVESILNQTFSDIEIILIDDGSPDHCGEICDGYKRRDSRIFVIHQENGGLASARNAGLEWVFQHSNSQWISFVDSDDWLHPEMLERLYGAAEEYGVKLSVCAYERTKSELHTFDPELLEAKILDSMLFYKNYGVNATVAWGKLYRRSCFEHIRYPVGKLHEDEFTTYRIIFDCSQVAMIEAPLYAYFENPNSIMNQWNPKRLASMEAYQDRIRFFSERGLTELQHDQEIAYIWNIVNHIKEIEKSDVSIRRQYEKKMRVLLRKELRKRLELIPFNSNRWFYEAAYPNLMRVYWRIINVVHGEKI